MFKGVISTKKRLLVIGIAVLLLAGGLSGCYDYESISNTGESHIIIKDCQVSVDRVGIDKLYIDSIDVLLENEGSSSVGIYEIVLSSGDSEIGFILFLESIDAGEEKSISSSTWNSLNKELGIKELNAIVSIVTYGGEVSAEKDIIIPIPTMEVGDTISEVGIDKHNLSFTLLSWTESDVALSSTRNYAYIKREGFKFVVITFEYKNNWIREQTTPYLSSGEILTDNGYIYSIWDWTDHYGEYETRTATEEEINTLIGDSASFESLLPEGSVKGCIVFEIPEDETALEISIYKVPPIIKLE